VFDNGNIIVTSTEADSHLYASSVGTGGPGLGTDGFANANSYISAESGEYGQPTETFNSGNCNNGFGNGEDCTPTGLIGNIHAQHIDQDQWIHPRFHNTFASPQ